MSFEPEVPKSNKSTPKLGANRVPSDDAGASIQQYKAFIQNSSEGIWRSGIEKPIPINLSAVKQIELMYRFSYLAEANDAFAKFYGFKSANQIIGIRMGKLLDKNNPRVIKSLTDFVNSGYRISGVEQQLVRKNGKKIFLRNSLTGTTKNGFLIGAWGTMQNVTEQQKSIEELTISEERLALAMKVSNMGMWEWDIVSDELHTTPELNQLFGLKPTQNISYEQYLNLLHPEDRKSVERIITNTMKTGEMHQMEFRIVWPDKSTHWLGGHAQAFSEKGKVVRMLGTVQNVDSIKEAESTILEKEEQFKNMVDEQTALVELNDAKDEFISLASHQLRTPATGVKQFIGMLLENYFGELTEDQHTMLEYAYESNERQLEVINDLLKVAQVDAGKVVLAKQKTDLAKLLEKIMQGQRSQFARRKQRVILDRPKEPIYAQVDESRIRMVIENLVDNASKYTPDGKSITVSIDKTKNNKFIAIKVKDEGVGIAKEDIPKLFQKFLRLDNPLSIQVGGTGIGLYWAKKIVDLHGGDILLKSRLGKGTTFTVMIPA